jgi:hypothetical protein
MIISFKIALETTILAPLARTSNAARLPAEVPVKNLDGS